MRPWKHVLLLIGILGVAGIFAPMLVVKHGKMPVQFSARRLSFDFERAYAVVERDLPRVAEKYLPRSVRSTREDARLVTKVARWAVAAYVPAALLALTGLIGIFLRRFGRGLGALAVLLGLGSVGAWVGLRVGIPIALEESGLERTSIQLLFGAHILLLAGVAGVLAGIGALLWPDLGARGPRPPRPAAAGRPPGLPSPPSPPPPGPPPGFPPPSTPPPGPPPHSDG
ncbi:MAG TPA: hypothetical protein VNO30_05685 [Kofleriaceae bacterium]|nr:hypothetical protein [Kofleriaceae bacterium]